MGLVEDRTSRSWAITKSGVCHRPKYFLHFCNGREKKIHARIDFFKFLLSKLHDSDVTDTHHHHHHDDVIDIWCLLYKKQEIACFLTSCRGKSSSYEEFPEKVEISAGKNKTPHEAFRVVFCFSLSKSRFFEKFQV
jgi:hypothetical protein